MVTFDEVMTAGRNAFGVQVWEGDPTLRAFVEEHARRYRKAMRRLEATRGDAYGGRLHGRAYWALRGFSCKYCALLLGLATDQRPITPEWAEETARALNLRQDCGEPIRAWPKFKSDGGFRAIAAYGPLRRAGQRLTRDVLRSVWRESPYEYARQGRGRDSAVRAVMGATKHKGGRWYLIADIENCYSSYDRDGAATTIPLPRSVIENTIFVTDKADIILPKTNKNLHSPLSTAVRAGLSQGSLVSPLVSSKFLESVLAALPARRVICHGDNIVAVCGTEAEAVANKQALESLLASHPAGPLQLKEVTIVKLGERFDFLGYWIRSVAKIYPGFVRAHPSARAFRRFEQRLRRELLGEAPDLMIEVAARKAKAWMGAYGLWHRSQAALDLLEAGLVMDAVHWARGELAGTNKVLVAPLLGTVGSVKGTLAEFDGIGLVEPTNVE